MQTQTLQVGQLLNPRSFARDVTAIIDNGGEGASALAGFVGRNKVGLTSGDAMYGDGDEWGDWDDWGDGGEHADSDAD